MRPASPNFGMKLAARAWPTSLLSATEAYRQAGYEEAGADHNAARLIRRESIENRIKELRAESYEMSKMSKEEALALLAEIAGTPEREVEPSDKICQSVKRTQGDRWSSVEVKVPDKIEAINTLTRLRRWNEANKYEFEHSGNVL